MCGIVGIINIDRAPVPEAVLQEMTGSLAHRGPDDRGTHLDGHAGFGHHRLAILDLSPTGRQPMMSTDGRLAIVYNGEIYNFRELRTELEERGCSFRSTSDTEVALQAYAMWGPEVVTRFNGMFAMAVWDRERETLFLARDRYGIKPLYYGFFDKSFIFSSENKAIMQHPSFRKEVDLEALLEYFTFQNIFTGRTFFKDVRLFPPGCWAMLNPGKNGRRLDFVQYWDFNFQEPETPSSESEYLEEFDHLFRQAVRRQLVSDVEIGSYLSSGMDSGSITAVAAGELPYIKTFTCGFDLHSASGLELAFDEREKAEHMSYLFKTEHYEMVLKAGDMERIMSRLVWHLEEPRVGQCYPNYYIAQLASKFLKVVLAGTGGDELFGGYPWRYYRAVVNDGFEDYVDRYYSYWQRLIPNRIIQELFKPVWPEVKHVWTRDIFRGVFSRHVPDLKRPVDYINYSLYFEAKTFLHGLLMVEDKLSMAHGLESRVPFLDNDLVDFAMEVPVKLKLRNLGESVRLNENDPGRKGKKYFQKTQDGKLIMREALSRYVPQEITRSVKKGFSAPDASWFRGESIDYLKRRIFNPEASIYQFLDRETVRTLVEEHLQGTKNRRLLIWSLLSLEEWAKKFL